MRRMVLLALFLQFGFALSPASAGPLTGWTLLASSWTGNQVLRYDAATGVLQGVFAPVGGPSGLALGHDGDVYVSSTNTGQILRYDTTGNFLGVFATQLDFPGGLAFGSDGDLYVAAGGAHEAYRLDGITGALKTGYGPSAGSGAIPHGLVVGPGDALYVGNVAMGKVNGYDAAGTPTASWDVPGWPYGLAIGPDGKLYAAGLFASVVGRLDEAPNVFTTFAAGAPINGATGLAFGPDANLWLGNAWGNVGILRYNGTTGAYIDQFASAENISYLLFIPPPAAVPEPASLLLLGSGLVGLVRMRRRRQ